MAAAPAQDVAEAGIEQAQVIMNFRDGADGAPRGGHRLAAGDRDGRRNALDPLGVRLFQGLEVLASVGGERLDVAPLPPVTTINLPSGRSRSRPLRLWVLTWRSRMVEAGGAEVVVDT